MTDLARARLVLSSGHGGRGWIVWCALLVVALLAGAAGSHVWWSQRYAELQRQSVAPQDLQQLRQALEQSRLTQRVSDGRSQELERQIDALNQRLRECQEEVTFFRKAREAKHN
jgi:uncharacterized protein HemX